MERIEYIDQLKGLAIILVVVAHVINSFGIQNNLFSDFIASFHTRLFMFLSGIFFYKKNSIYNANLLYKYLKKRFLRIIIPFLVIGGFYSFTVHNDIVPILIGSVDDLWFLPTLFNCIILGLVYVFIVQKINSNIFKLLILLFYSSSLIIIWHIGLIKFIPYSFMTVHMFPYFIFGYLFKHFENVKNIVCNEKLYVPSIILFIVFMKLNLPFKFEGFFIIIVLIQFFSSIKNCIPAFLSYYGRNSLEIYILHFWFLPKLLFISDFFYKYDVINASFNNNIIIIIIGAIIIAIPILYLSIFLGIILKSNKYSKYLVGAV